MGTYELLLSLSSASMQMFAFTKWSVVLRPCFVRWYFKQFVAYY
jgi:hypothetical protein